ncbi:hypothetical protein FAIPA1_50106 [Frankia sp. AiPs1]
MRGSVGVRPGGGSGAGCRVAGAGGGFGAEQGQRLGWGGAGLGWGGTVGAGRGGAPAVGASGGGVHRPAARGVGFRAYRDWASVGRQVRLASRGGAGSRRLLGCPPDGRRRSGRCGAGARGGVRGCGLRRSGWGCVSGSRVGGCW